MFNLNTQNRANIKNDKLYVPQMENESIYTQEALNQKEDQTRPMRARRTNRYTLGFLCFLETEACEILEVKHTDLSNAIITLVPK